MTFRALLPDVHVQACVERTSASSNTQTAAAAFLVFAEPRRGRQNGRASRSDSVCSAHDNLSRTLALILFGASPPPAEAKDKHEGQPSTSAVSWCSSGRFSNSAEQGDVSKVQSRLSRRRHLPPRPPGPGRRGGHRDALRARPLVTRRRASYADDGVQVGRRGGRRDGARVGRRCGLRGARCVAGSGTCVVEIARAVC